MKVFERITGSTIKEEVYRSIKDAILNGKLRPEDTLVEMEIAREMNISRAPIREALNKLEQERFVVSVPRKGYHVAPITEKGIKEIYETRLLMEPFAIRKTIGEIRLEEILEVEGFINEVRNNLNDYEIYIKADKSLHGLLHKYLSNEYMKNIMVAMEEHSMRTRYSESYEGLNKRDVLMIIDEHMEIINALKHRNAEEAALAVYNHVANGEKRTLNPIISHGEET